MTDNNSADDGDRIDRRTCLKVAGAAVGGAALATGFDLDTDDVADAGSQLHFGYGGGPILVAGASALATGESEVNDASANADPIDTDTEVSGTLETAGVDWFAFDATAEESFDVVFDRVSADGVTSVVVYGPDCGFLGLRQVGTDRQVAIPETPVETGTHYVEVVDVQAGDGDYTLQVVTDGSATATETATPSPTATDSPTATPSPTDSPTATPSPTATATPSPTDSPTATATPSPTATEVVDEYGEQGYGDYGYGGAAD